MRFFIRNHHPLINAPRLCAAALLFSLAFFPRPAAAQLAGTDTTPGSACSPEDSMRLSANPSGTGGYVLTCEGGIWVATLNAATPTSNAQVATKQYVDSTLTSGALAACTNDTTTLCALETSRATDDPQFTSANIVNGVNILGVTGSYTGGLTGPSGCARIGALCADGTVFAGWDPVYHNQIFIPTTDQGTTSQWKTADGTDDIATDSYNDGLANSNQLPNSATFPAVKLCKDLTTGSHSDWYLPSRTELYYLWVNRPQLVTAGNITDFQAGATYWSSTELDPSDVWFMGIDDAYQNSGTKTAAYRVRCMRHN